jgi:hypothetical protein
MWPPRRLSAVTARSRLTRRPADVAEEVLSRVSCMTSAVHTPSGRPDDGQAAAVDRDRVAEAGALEHGAGADGEPDRVVCSSIASTVPSSSMMPVNISSFRGKVVRGHGDADAGVLADRLEHGHVGDPQVAASAMV